MRISANIVVCLQLRVVSISAGYLRMMLKVNIGGSVLILCIMGSRTTMPFVRGIPSRLPCARRHQHLRSTTVLLGGSGVAPPGSDGCENKGLSMSTTAPESPVLAGDKYSVNGLTYTKMGLVTVFLWLLFGGLIFNVMEIVKPKVLPLFLMGNAGGIGASMTITNLMMVVIPGITGILIGPAVSFKSDRYRSKRGRRIPYIIWTTPLLVLALIGIGLAPYYRDYFNQVGGLSFLSAKNATLLLIGLFVVMFHVFDEFVNSVFWYLFADVVPEAFIGRFVALFNMVGQAAAVGFNWYLFRYAETHVQWIFIGVGLVYLVAFTMVCLNIKEGQYPPPDDLGENPSILKQMKVYVVECFSHRIYIYTFLFTASLAFAMGANAGAIIFHRDGIRLSMEVLSDIGGYIALVGMFVAFPAGWAVDKWHPLRITMLMMFPLIALQFFAFYFLTDMRSYIALEGGKMVFFALFSAASIPMLITLFPKDKYGQFCSCNGMVRSTSLMIGGVFAGFFMDYMTSFSADKIAFKWVYMWGGVFQISGLYFLWLLYREWKRRGGDTAYVAPGSAKEKERIAQARDAQDGDAAIKPI